MLAALAAAGTGAVVVLLEKNRRLGCKMSITGGGRCNLTNTAPVREFVGNTPGGGKFLMGALSRFSGGALMDYLGDLGVETKVEEQGRVFPASDRAVEVIEALERQLRRERVKIKYEVKAESLLVEGGRCLGVSAGGGSEFLSRTVVIATGGASHPRTGSTGDGYRLAAGAGHTVISPGPGLVPLRLAGEAHRKLQGLTVHDALLKLTDSMGKKISAVRGDFIFTHFGVSGPATLAISREVSVHRRLGHDEVFLVVDFMPDVKEADLAGRLWSLTLEQSRKSGRSLVRQLLPERLADVLADLAGLDANKKSAETGKQAWRKIACLIKGWHLLITGTRSLEEAMITVGGVSTGEVDPRTMASRLVEGLFFCGEVIDVDAYTGGFNMQIAFSTGRLAGLAAAEKAKKIAQGI